MKYTGNRIRALSLLHSTGKYALLHVRFVKTVISIHSTSTADQCTELLYIMLFNSIIGLVGQSVSLTALSTQWCGKKPTT